MQALRKPGGERLELAACGQAAGSGDPVGNDAGCQRAPSCVALRGTQRARDGEKDAGEREGNREANEDTADRRGDLCGDLEQAQA